MTGTEGKRSVSDIFVATKSKLGASFRNVIFDGDGNINRRNACTFGLSLLLLLLSFVYDPVIFIKQGGAATVPYGKAWIWFTKVLLFILLIFFWNYVLSRGFRSLRFAFAYLVPVLIIFVLVYPGVWRWDDLIILQNVSYGYIYYWQHWLSSVYYYFCMCIIPIPSGVVIVQSIIISFIVGHVVERVYGIVGKWAFLLYIPLFLPFVLDTVYYPMRASLSGFMELYLVFEMLITALRHEDVSKGRLWTMVMVAAILSAWRPENVLWILVFAVFLFFVYKFSFKTTCKYVAVGVVIVLLSMAVQSSGLKDSNWESSTGEQMSESELYTLTGFIAPFGELVKIASERGEFQDELARVDESISVEMICDHSGIYAFWNGGLKSLTKEQLSDLEHIYVKLIIAYMPEFFKERWDTFMETNGYGSSETMLKASAHIYDDPETMPEELRGPYTDFIEEFYLNKPVNAELRKEIVSAMEMKYESDYYSSSTGLQQYMYNCLPVFIIILMLGVAALIMHRWVYALISLGMILKAAVVFMAAPMALYMYYFSTELICSVMIMFCLAVFVHKKLAERTDLESAE